jgi:H+/Cl- antiporter ClcA
MTGVMELKPPSSEPVWPPFIERGICAAVGVCLFLLTTYIALSAWFSTPADPLFRLCIDPHSSKDWRKADYLLALILFAGAGTVGLLASLTRNHKIYHWKSRLPPPSPRVTMYFALVWLLGVLLGEYSHAQSALSSFDADGRCSHALKPSPS